MSHANPQIAQAPSAFDQLAKSYLDDYQQDRPIAGGMAYETRVRACHLDGSADSLKRLDRLLSTLKDELAHNSETLLLQRADFRRFVLFLGFYVGQVLASQTGQTLCWVASTHTAQTKNERFYQVAALCPCGSSQPAFFVWQSVGATLFASDDRKFIDPIQKTYAPQSLYWAFKAYEEALLPKADMSLSAKAPSTPSRPSLSAPKTQTDKPPIKTQSPTKQPKTPQNQINKSIAKSDNQTTQNKKLSPKPLATKDNHFAEIEQDLIALPAVNDIHHAEQKKTMAVLANLRPPLTKDKQTLAKQALQQLHKVAGLGNTDAMLQLGLFYFKGHLIKGDPKKALMWVKRAADMNDPRAQKLLSRLYYQGLGVEMSTEQGLYWLSRAADNGHAEAIKLKRQFDAISLIKDEQKAEDKKDKQYMVMFAIVGVIVLVLLWILVKFAGGQ